MLFEFSVLLRCPSPLKCTKRHSKLRRSTATTSMTRWSFPLHWKLDARLSIPKTFTMARQLMDNSPFEIPSLDHPANQTSAAESQFFAFWADKSSRFNQTLLEVVNSDEWRLYFSCCGAIAHSRQRHYHRRSRACDDG